MIEAVLFDLDRTLVDLQTYTDYAAALADVETMVGAWEDPPIPATDWDTPTRLCMSILVALSGDRRWAEVSDLITVHERRAIPLSRSMPRIREAIDRSDHLPRAVVTLLGEEPARSALRRHGVDIPVLVPRRADLRPKPAPDQIREACRMLGVAPADAVMIGDSSWDADAAADAGCGFVGVPATEAGTSCFGNDVATAPDLVAALDIAGLTNGP